MKKIFLSLPLILFLGCSGSKSNLNPFTKQPSISTQKMDAANAWDELEGKVVSIPKQKTTKIQKSISKPTQTIKKSPDITNVAKSMLETSDTIPNWFYSPPKSDKYFYGSGEGRNIQEAKASALNLIAGDIQTAISSSMSINQGYSNYNGNRDFYKSVKSKVRTEVKEINFTNIEVMKTVKINNKIYLLVRINKQKLFNSLKTKFDLLNSKIDNEIKISKKYSKLDQLITLNRIEPQIQKALSLGSILNVLNPNFDIKPYAKKYMNYLNQKTKLLHEITFGVRATGMFAHKLIEVLNEHGYKVAKHSDIKINISKRVRNSITMGMAISRVTITLQVIAKNKILTSNSIEVKGISNTHKQALAKAAIDFKQKIEKIGINKLLGFE